jgi:crotonobetainyl-CoA:carnitine CoA-transferase CaiB-like acyl-CoA transferase
VTGDVGPRTGPAGRAGRALEPVDGALAGLRICDFTGVLAGAGATKFLAAFGAQVIRVEDPVRKGQWDILRGAPPFKDNRRGIEFGSGFNNHNVGKLGVTLNLKTEEGRELLRRLIEISDVVTENFAAGVLAKLGFPYEAMAAIRPDIIYVSNCGFGHTGPYRTFKTWGPIVQAVSGLTFTSGLPDQPPAGWGYSYMDHTGAYYMAIAVLAGLWHRRRTGEGQWIDLACTEAATALTGPAILDWAVNGRAMRRPAMPDSNRNQWPPMAPHGIYATSGEDNWVAISCRSDQEWKAIATVINDPWAAGPEYATLAGRLEREDALDAHMDRWTRTQERFDLAARLQRLGVPAAAVTRPPERIDHDPDVDAWGLWPTVDHPAMGEVRVDGLPVHLSETDWAIRQGAPLLGEHTDLVLTRLLGVDPADLERLRGAGVI